MSTATFFIPMTKSVMSLTVVTMLLCPSTADEIGQNDAFDFFERHVRPILVHHCIECHGPDEQESGLRLDSRATLLRGGKRGMAVVPGDASQSLVVKAIRREGELKMPPDEPLPPEKIALLEKWIEYGAAWPVSQRHLTPENSDEAKLARVAARRKQHWAFQRIQKPDPPTSDEAQWARNEIDNFVLARLRANGLTPSPEADSQTLARRLHFDLMGLPPNYSDVESFVRDETPKAYERLVASLLDRPEYGEKWARHWLDIARYADTTGYHEGGERRYPFAWNYRDYVVRSLNQDTPFNDFVVEQIAADRLELEDHQKWKLAAMGFLTLGPRFNHVRHEIIDDRIDTLTRGFMGLTVTCARCHDHKYDPVLAADYYGLYGVFASSKEPVYADLPRIGLSRGKFSRYRRFRQKVAAATRSFEQFHTRVHQRILHETRALAADYLRYLVQLMPNHRTINQPKFETKRGRIRGPTPYGPGAIVRWQHYIDSRDDNDPVFGLWKAVSRLQRDDVSAKIPQLVARQQGLNSRLRDAIRKSTPTSMLEVASVYGEQLEQVYKNWMEHKTTNPEATRLSDDASEQLRQVLYADDSPVVMNEDEAHDCYTDGEFNQYMGRKRELDSLFVEYQDVAAPRAMIMIDRDTPVVPRIHIRGQATRPGDRVERRFLRMLADVDDANFQNGSGRLELAKAIVSPNNPLTARVIVNRIWQWHFGRGLVDTPSDFGTRASPPSHPKLLDWLAADFMEHGWSLKRLHRQIVHSATWRQASFASPKAAEIDPENRLLSHMVRRRLDVESLRDAILCVTGRIKFQQGGLPVDELESPRRSLYLLVNRDDQKGFFATFDFPSPDISIAQRTQTTVPQQALFMMNSRFSTAMAQRIVANMRQELDDASGVDRVDWLYKKILSRLPKNREIEIALNALANDADDQQAPTDSAWMDLAHVLLMSNEFLFVD